MVGNERKGFTLVEILIVIGIMTLVIGGALAIYIMSQTAWYEGSVQIALQRKGSIAMERMVRGVRAAGEDKKNGIREAKFVSISDSSTILFTSGIDDRERSFYLQGDEILYNPDLSTAGDEISIAENVTDLNFEMLGAKWLRIELSLERRVLGKPINVSITTDVTLRN